MSPDAKLLIVFCILFAACMVFIARVEMARRKRRAPSLAEMLRLFAQLTDEQQEQELAILRDRVKVRRE